MNPPGSISTLTELLKYRGSESPEDVAFIINDTSYNYRWLWEKSQSYAAQLIDENVRENERVLMLVPNSAAFFPAFYGCLLSGAIAVPIFPGAGTDRCDQIMQLCKARHVILPAHSPEARKQAFVSWALSNEFEIHWVDPAMELSTGADFPFIPADKIAFIQYTSGSTDFPKGVPLTHYNLMSNIKQMVEAMHISSKDVFVSWLPVYHDMGLILKTMVPLYTGAVLNLLDEGLHKVHSWLKSIEQYQGTFIAAPDVAYRLCVQSIRKPENYDLSSLRVALNASERIRSETYQLFEETFHLSKVMSSGYGLAEATVAVTMHPPGQPPAIDSEGYVASGKALKGIDIKIDVEAFENAGTGKQKTGEILVKSEGLMKGYFNSRTVRHPIDEDGFLRTGDIGYLDEMGNLYVLARKKNCIKHAGHTLYPDDLEEVVKSVDGIRQVAALGIEGSSGKSEGLYVVAEFREHRTHASDVYHRTAVAIVERINDHFGIKPARLFLVKPKTLPRTPNGKMQHSALKHRYLNEQDSFRQLILYP